MEVFDCLFDYLQAEKDIEPVKKNLKKGDTDYYLTGTKSSGIRKKGESQNEYFKKAKHAKISEKQTFLIP